MFALNLIETHLLAEDDLMSSDFQPSNTEIKKEVGGHEVASKMCPEARSQIRPRKRFILAEFAQNTLLCSTSGLSRSECAYGFLHVLFLEVEVEKEMRLDQALHTEAARHKVGPVRFFYVVGLNQSKRRSD